MVRLISNFYLVNECFIYSFPSSDSVDPDHLVIEMISDRPDDQGDHVTWPSTRDPVPCVHIPSANERPLTCNP